MALSAAAQLARELRLPAWAIPDPVLPVRSDLATVLPGGGLHKGQTLSVIGSLSLLLSMASEVSVSGAWCAAIGFPSLGAVAAAELGIDLERFVVIPEPGIHWATAAAVLMDGADLLLISPPPGSSPAELRRLLQRARERKVVILSDKPWEGADLRITATATHWSGLGQGHGHLASRTIELSVEGRRLPRARTASLSL